MTFWLLLLLGVFLLAIAGGFGYLAADSDAFAPVILTVVFGLAGLLLIIMPTVNAIERHMNAVSCHSWGEQTGVPAKWASYNWWDYGCLAKTANGHWVPIQNYNSFVRGHG